MRGRIGFEHPDEFPEHYVTHPTVHVVVDCLGAQVECALEEEHGRHDAHEVGGCPPEQEVVNEFHRAGWMVWERKLTIITTATTTIITFKSSQ